MAMIKINVGGTWKKSWGSETVSTPCSCSSGCKGGCSSCAGCSGTCQSSENVISQYSGYISPVICKSCRADCSSCSGGCSGCRGNCYGSCANGCSGACQGCTATNMTSNQTTGYSYYTNSYGYLKVNVSNTWKVPQFPRLNVSGSWRNITK